MLDCNPLKQRVPAFGLKMPSSSRQHQGTTASRNRDDSDDEDDDDVPLPIRRQPPPANALLAGGVQSSQKHTEVMDDDNKPLPKKRQPPPANALLAGGVQSSQKHTEEEDDDDKPLPNKRQVTALPAGGVQLKRKHTTEEDEDDEDFIDMVSGNRHGNNEKETAKKRVEQLEAELGAERIALAREEAAIARRRARIVDLERDLRAACFECDRRAPGDGMLRPAGRQFQFEYSDEELRSWKDPTWPKDDSVGTGIDDAVRILRHALGDSSVAAMQREELVILPNPHMKNKLCSITIRGEDKNKIWLSLHTKVISRTTRSRVESGMTYLAQAANELLEIKRNGGSLADKEVNLRHINDDKCGTALHEYRSRVAKLFDGETLLKNPDEVYEIVSIAADRMNNPQCIPGCIRYKKRLEVHRYNMNKIFIYMSSKFLWRNPPRNVLNEIMYAFCNWLVIYHSSPPVQTSKRSELSDAMAIRLGIRIEQGMYTPMMPG